jgi:sugar lactone lactonase YvrE
MNGTAVVTPGNIPVTSNVPFTIDHINTTTTYICTVTSGSGLKISSTVQVVVLPPPVTLNYAVPTSTYYKDVRITANPATTGGTGSYTYTVVPTLPAGLNINPTSGAISGTPQAVTAVSNYTITAKDTVNQSASAVLSIAVDDTPVMLTLSNAAIAPGGGSVLAWAVSGVFSSMTITSDPADASLPASFAMAGTANIAPLVTTNYTLTAVPAGGGNNITRTVGLTVGNAPVGLTAFTASPATTPFGGSSTLTWTYTGVPLALAVDGASVLGLPSLPVSPVRRQTYQISGSNVLNVAPSTMTTTVVARGIDLLAGHIGGQGMRDGVGQYASFFRPNGIAADAAGNIYVADTFNFTIRKISPGGTVTTLAGSPGVSAFLDGVGSAAQFKFPFAIDSDNNGNLLVAEWNSTATGGFTATGGKIRLVKPNGTVTTVTGMDGQGTATGAYSPATHNQIWTQEPYAIAIDKNASTATTLVAWYTDYNWRTVGKFTVNVADGAATLIPASIPATPTPNWSQTSGLTVGPDGTLYIADTGNNCIRKLVFDGTTSTVTTLVGVASSTTAPVTVTDSTLSCLNKPYGLATTSNGAGGIYLFIADKFNSAIRRVNLNAAGAVINNRIDLVAGPAVATSLGAADGPGASATFLDPQGMCFANGLLYVADSGYSIARPEAIAGTFAYNNTIRVMDNNVPANNVTTFAGASYTGTVGNIEGTGAAARFKYPTGLASDSQGNIFVADYGNGSIRKVDAMGAVTTATTGLTNPAYVAVDASDNVYFIERAATGTTSNLKYLKKSDGSIQTMTLTGGTLAQTVTAMSFDAAKTNLYVGDGASVKQIAIATGIVTTLATTGTVNGICANSTGIYWTDSTNHVVRTAPSITGTVTVIAGIAATKSFVNGIAGVGTLYTPTGILLGLAPITGHKALFIADAGNSAIRVVDLEATGTPLGTLIGIPTSTNWISFFGNKPGRLQTGSAALDGSIWRPVAITATPSGDFVIISNNGLLQISAPNDI